jgi:gliding motility-associated-like protein
MIDFKKRYCTYRYWLLISLFVILCSLQLDAQPVPSFTASPTSGCVPLTVRFTNTTTSATTPVTYRWDLGNGTTSVLANPITSYLAPGFYTVKLVATNVAGSDSVISTDFVKVFPQPVANFSLNDSLGCVPHVVKFTDLSTTGIGAITAWEWDFGDGNISTDQNPQHVYGVADVFSVNLKVTNTGGCFNNFTRQQLVNVAPRLQAQFNFSNPVQCTPPETIQFVNKTDSSQPLQFKWFFGDGDSSTQKHPVHQYNNGGIYSVQLIINNAAGCSDTLTKTDSIIIGNNKPAIAGPDTICAGTSATFSNLSVPLPLATTWNFGDSLLVNEFSTTNFWPTPGLFSIKMINEYATCKDSIIKWVTVLPKPLPRFRASDSASCNVPFTTTFTGLTPGIAAYTWYFGNGDSSILPSPTYTYNSLGRFTVMLKLTDSLGCSNLDSVSQIIRLQKPVARIANAPNGNCLPYAYRAISSSTSAEGIANYFWDFGDGNTSTAVSPINTYTLPGSYTLKLRITSIDGCQDSVTIVGGIKTGTQPFVGFNASPIEQCVGSPVQFTDTSALPNERWIWSFGDGRTSTLQNPVNNYRDTGLYNVRFIAFKSGCSDTIVKLGYIRIKGSRSNFGFAANCTIKNQIQFTDSTAGATSWNWNFGDGTFSNLQNPVHTYVPNQWYNVTLLIRNDTCSNSITKRIYVNNLPPDFTALRDTICYGDSLRLRVVLPPNVTYRQYLWDFGDGDTSIRTQPSITHRYDTAGFYTVRLITIDNSGCRDTITKLNRYAVFAPNARFAVDQFIACRPAAITFTNTSTVAPAGNNLVSLSWNFGDSTLLDQFNPLPVATTHSYSTNGVYFPSLIVKDLAGCTDTFTQVRPIIISKPQASLKDSTIFGCPGQLLSVVNTSTGDNPSYFWQFADNTTSTLANPSRQFAANGNYAGTLTVTDVYGCKDTLQLDSLFSIQEVVADFDMSDSIGRCIPFMVNFTNGSQFAVFNNWDFGDGNTSSLRNPVHFYTTPGNYTVTLTARRNASCTSVATKNIRITIPQGQLTYGPLDGCAPLNVALTIRTQPGLKFLYDLNDGNAIETTDTSIIYTYTSPGKFVPLVIMEDSTGCLTPIVGTDTVRLYSSAVKFVADDTVLCDNGWVQFTDSTVSGSAVTAYLWNFGDGTQATVQNPNHFYNSTGLYNVQLKINTIFGCVDSAIKNQYIKVVKKPDLTIVGDSVFCGPSTLQLSGVLIAPDTSAITWQWQLPGGTLSNVANPTPQLLSNAGTYPVTTEVINSSGCRDTAFTNVIINPLPPTFGGNDAAVCQSQPFVLQATGADTYVWQPASLLSCTNCSNPTVTLSDNSTLFVTGTTTAGCSTTDSIYYRVKKPFVLTGLPATAILCAGSSLNLNVVGGELYDWQPAIALSNTNSNSTVASPLSSTTYKVISRDSISCFTDSAAIAITVYPIPVVNAGEDKLVAYQEVVPINASYSADVLSYNWSPANYLSCITCPNPISVPDFNSTYTIQVTNAGGCTAQDKITIKLTCDDKNITMPGAFTPNGDALNEYYYPLGKGIFKIQSFKIFNRLGEMVFVNSNFGINVRNAGWNGIYKGKQADVGTYIYVIEAVCNNNTLQNFSGKFLLLR